MGDSTARRPSAEDYALTGGPYWLSPGVPAGAQEMIMMIQPTQGMSHSSCSQADVPVSLSARAPSAMVARREAW